MAASSELPSWVRAWLAVASLLVALDCVYILSMVYGAGGLVPSVLLELWGWYGESDTQYAASGAGLAASNGWIATQSKFNVLELAAQLAVLFVLPRGSPAALLTTMVTSICTLYKTLLYMAVIAHTPDPAHMVPLLACLGMQPLPQNAASVASALAKDGCAAQFFKFQFNFWWIVCPAAVACVCWRRIANALSKVSKAAKQA
eukprot:TRINITY_DN5494_c0_g5_i1.p1 TRINITY_DN5494_c0_g5~~TRINITY_DN5494_c0_g5_i1.p1  ORF type:complete len:202 (+),score=65.06 TRINITY_DN5494_c0_g5_i1:93-698(+)